MRLVCPYLMRTKLQLASPPLLYMLIKRGYKILERGRSKEIQSQFCVCTPVWRSERERSDQLPEEDLSNVRSTDLDNEIYHSELEVTG